MSQTIIDVKFSAVLLDSTDKRPEEEITRWWTATLATINQELNETDHDFELPGINPRGSGLTQLAALDHLINMVVDLNARLLKVRSEMEKT